jgi:site-specific DNA recombinase
VTTDDLAIEFGRVSTPEQNDPDKTSIDTQLAATSDYRTTHDLGLLRQVREVYSGAEFWERPELNAAREDLNAGRAKHLIAYTTDRLSRGEPVNLLILLSEAERYGWTLHFVCDPLESSQEGKLILYVKGYAHWLEREKIKERTLRGKRALAMQGLLLGMGNTLYGYADSKPPKRSVGGGRTQLDRRFGNITRNIREDQAEVVRMTFEHVAEARSMYSLVQDLNARHVPTPSGRGRWGRTSIIRMLSEPAYKGDSYAFRWKNTKTVKNGKVHRTNALRPEHEWIALPAGTTPPIVSADLWQQANARVKVAGAPARRNLANAYLLRGLIVCSQCGCPMYPQHERQKRIYRCASYAQASGSCGASRAFAEPLEQAVWAAVQDRIKAPESFVPPEPDVCGASGDYTDVRGLQRQVARLEAKQQEWLQRADDSTGRTWELVQQHIERLEVERQAVLANIASAEAAKKAREHLTDFLKRIVAAITRVQAGLPAVLHTFEQQRTALLDLGVTVLVSGRAWRIEGQLQLAGVEAKSCSGCA